MSSVQKRRKGMSLSERLAEGDKNQQEGNRSCKDENHLGTNQFISYLQQLLRLVNANDSKSVDLAKENIKSFYKIIENSDKADDTTKAVIETAIDSFETIVEKDSSAKTIEDSLHRNADLLSMELYKLAILSQRIINDTVGRKKCEVLRKIRESLVDANDLDVEIVECYRIGDCSGTCPACEAEMEQIAEQLGDKAMNGEEVYVPTIYADERYGEIFREFKEKVKKKSHLVRGRVERPVFSEIEKAKRNRNGRKYPVCTIEKLRMETDGEGSRTLIVMHGCPLKCKCCINKQTWDGSVEPTYMTAGEIFDEIIRDWPYLISTNGGITFGGGEPLLYSELIFEMRRLLDEFQEINNLKNRITIFVETSFSVPKENYNNLSWIVDKFYVDIKSLNEKVYREYTGSDLRQYMMMLDNLNYISELGSDIWEKFTIIIPAIPGFTDEKDQLSDKEQIEKLGFTDIELFDYISS